MYNFFEIKKKIYINLHILNYYNIEHFKIFYKYYFQFGLLTTIYNYHILSSIYNKL